MTWFREVFVCQCRRGKLQRTTHGRMVAMPSVRLVSLISALYDPAAQGQSCASLRCDCAFLRCGPVDTIDD